MVRRPQKKDSDSDDESKFLATRGRPKAAKVSNVKGKETRKRSESFSENESSGESPRPPPKKKTKVVKKAVNSDDEKITKKKQIM
jgi:hypothetical protein